MLMNIIKAPSTEDLQYSVALYEVELDGIQNKLTEATVLPDENTDIFAQAAEINNMLQAAKKGLGLISTKKANDSIGNKDIIRKHKSQIMSNMNRIRGRLRRLDKAIEHHFERYRAGSEAQTSPEPVAER